MVNLLIGLYVAGALLSARVNFITIGTSYIAISNRISDTFPGQRHSSLLLYILICSQFVLATSLWIFSIRRYMDVWTMSSKEIRATVYKVHNDNR
jgi:hypothetical protein